MGAVYAGHDEKLDRKVALKVLHADQRLDVEARDRLLREARALSKVDHPNICRIHDYIDTGDVDLLVLEFIDGRTLQSAIDDGLPHAEKLRIARTIAEVLVRAHRAGIVHRDLKPENVMLTKAGEVKVLDFGLARWLQLGRRSSSSGNYSAITDSEAKLPVLGKKDDRGSGDTMVMPAVRASEAFPSGRREFLATAAGITLGTPLYMSPEQARGEALTPASDMFSFGLLLQVLFTGKEPHPDLISAREVILRVARGETNPVEGAPKAITALINSLKQFAPADRPTAVDSVERLKYLIATPQRIARRSAVAAVAAVMLFGGWRYTVDLDRERSIAVTERAEAQKQKARAEDLINFMVGDLRKKLEPVGRLDVMDDVAEKALQYVRGLRPEAMSVDELARNAKALNQLGEVRVGMGKTPEALKLFDQALVLAATAVDRDPKNPEAMLVLGASHFWLGNSMRLQGKRDEALHHMTDYQRVAEKLAKLDPSNTEYQRERSYGESNLASLLEERGAVDQALPHHLASLKIARMLAAADPAMRNDLTVALNKVGAALARTGDLRGAIDHLRQETAILRDAVAADTKNMLLRRQLATNLAWLARVLSATGDQQGALALWQEELGIERELAELDPDDVAKHRAVATTTRRIAGGLAHTGDSARAFELFRAARQEMSGVIAKAPTRASFQVDAAAIDADYADALYRAGKKQAALEAVRGAITRIEALASPGRFGQVELAREYVLLGELEATPEAAKAAWEKAAKAMEPLADSADPTDLDVWARVLIRQRRFDQARNVMSVMERTGFSMSELQRLCRESGC